MEIFDIDFEERHWPGFGDLLEKVPVVVKRRKCLADFIWDKKTDLVTPILTAVLPTGFAIRLLHEQIFYRTFYLACTYLTTLIAQMRTSHGTWEERSHFVILPASAWSATSTPPTGNPFKWTW